MSAPSASLLRSDDFSVVVQGPIHSSPERKGERDLTIRCLASIRTFLPGAEIILSTWKGAHVEGLDYDVLVESDDPGAVAYNDVQNPPGSNNVNRQIVSTRAGLAAAHRPYAIKFRGDLVFESDVLLQHGDALASRGPGGFFFARLLISPIGTRDPRRSPHLFHFSDIVQIGRIEDLRQFWSVPLAPEPETTRWLEGRKDCFSSIRPYHVRVAPEQYLVCAWLSQRGTHVYMDHPWQISPALALLSERTLLDNFRVYELDQLGVRFPERLIQAVKGIFYYRQSDWDKLSAAYANWPSRGYVKMQLLLLMYWNYWEWALKGGLIGSPLRSFPPYRWFRDLYRRFFPLR